MMGSVLIDLKSDKNALVLEMVNRDQTCIWLDVLLNNHNFKKRYAIHGRKNQEFTPKMKIYIEVEHVAANK
jgi:hypothetical protein